MPSDVLITPATSKIDFTDGANSTKKLSISGTAFSFNSNLNVLSSTSLSSAFKAEGVNGTLFEVTDDLSNSLMSVNTIGGLPVFEVFANNSIIGGQYGANDFVISGNKIGLGYANPVNKLTVSGSVSIGSSYNVAAPSNGLIVQGNVGIGTVSPSARLTIVDNTNGGIINLVGRTSDDTAAVNFRVTSDASTYAYISPDTNEFRLYHNDGFMSFYPGGTEKWRITAAGILESNGLQTIRTNTGNLTLATALGNGHILLSPHGTGNVGIGRASPQQKLHIAGTNARLAISNDSDNNWAEIGNDGSSGQNTLEFFTGSSVTSAMSITNANKVGIGTIAPVAKLHIGSDVEPNISNQTLFVQGSKTGYAGFVGLPMGSLMIYDDTASTAGSGGAISFGANTGSSQRTWIAAIESRRDSAVNDGTNYGGSLVFYTRPAQATPEERMRITSAGSFRTDLDASYHMGMLNEYVSTYVSRTKFGRWNGTSNLELYYDIAGTEEARITRNYNTAVLKFNRGSTTDMIIGSTGNVGIGALTPAGKLDVRGDFNIGGGSDGIRLGNVGDDAAYDNVKLYYTGYNSGNPRIYLTPRTQPGSGAVNTYFHLLSNTAGGPGANTIGLLVDGNVGIGTTTPAQKLELHDVVGDPYTSGVNSIAMMRFSNTTDNAILNIGMRAAGAGAWLQSTDKTNLGVNYPLLLNPNGGNVSVGSLTSNNKLHVNGSASIGSGYNTAATTNGLIVEGNVGIGITGPTAKLDVAGSNVSGYSLLLRSGDNYNGTDSVQIAFGFANQTNYRHSIRTRHNPAAPISGIVGNNIDFYVWKRGTDIAADLGSQFVMTMQGDGAVGIGITNPVATLHLNSTTSGATLLRADGTNGTLFSVVDDLSDSLMSVNNSAGLPVLEVFADDRVVAGQYGANDFVLRNNKIGIGNGNPSFKLDVTGSLGVNAGTSDGNWPFIVVDSISSGGSNRYALNKIGAMGFNYADSYAQLQLIGANGAYIDFGNAAIDDSDARIIYHSNNRFDISYGTTITLNSTGAGVGVLGPSAKLHVQTTAGSVTTPNVVAIFQANTDTTIIAGGGTAIKFRGVSSGGNLQDYDQCMISSLGYAGNNQHGMQFWVKPNAGTVLTAALTINNDSSVVANSSVTAASFSGLGTNLTGTASSLTAGTATNVAWSGITSKPTTLAGYALTDVAYGQAAYQSKSLDTVSTPGLYQYDGAFGGTKPPDNGANYRTVEIGSGSRFSQIAMPWNSENIYFRRITDSTYSAWRTVIHDGNYTSYPDATKLPLTGGTLTGAITVNGVSDAVVVQTNGNAAQWYGRISVRNSTSDKSSFLGTYQGIAGVFAHNNALSAWADLYVNTVDGTNGGIVRMSADVRIGGNAALHAATTSAPSLSIGGSSATCTGAAAAVPWSGITSKPTTLSGFGITDAMYQSNPNGFTQGDINGSGNMQRLWGTDSVQNLLAFRPPTTVEYTTDNVNWVATSISNNVFDNKVFGKWSGFNMNAGTNVGGWTKVRMTWVNFGYHFFSHFTLCHSTNGHSMNFVFYKSDLNGVFSSESYRVNGISSWPGYTFTAHNNVSGWWDTRDVRMVFELNGNNGPSGYPNNAISIGHIGIMGGYSSFNRLFEWDGNRNIDMYGNLSVAAGTVTALNFSGPGTSLTGTASSLVAGSANAIADGVVSTSAKISNSVVTLAKIENISTGTILGNNGVSAGAPIALTSAQIAAMLSGQTMNINGSSTTCSGLAASATTAAACTGNAAGLSATLAVASGGTGGNTQALGRTGLGATTVGANLFTLANPSAISFIRINAANTVEALNAADFRNAISAGTGNGTVTSVTGTAPIASSGGATPAISLNDAGVTTAKIANSNVTLAKLANISTGHILGNNTGADAAPLALTSAQVVTMLGIGTSSSGTVTNIATGDGLSGGPITATGTITVDTTVVRTTGTQTIGGAKTFSSTIAGSINGNAGSVTDGVYLSTNQSIGGVKTFSSAPVATNIAKAWVYYNMNNNTTYASYNVSSVADNGTGVCTVNFSTAMVDANYVVAGTATYGYDDADIYAMILAVPRRSTAQQAGSCRLATEYIHGAQVYDSVAVRAVFYR